MHKRVSFKADHELLTLLKSGDGDAFKEIYDIYSAKLYQAAYNIIRDKQECEDVIQEFFADLWLKRNTINISSSLKGYLFVSVKNKILMRLRSKKIILSADAFEFLADSGLSDGLVLEKELRSCLNREIAELPDKCAQIFKLSRNEQLSNKEIASQLDVSVKTVENQIGIAIKRLRSSMSDFLVLVLLFFFL